MNQWIARTIVPCLVAILMLSVGAAGVGPMPRAAAQDAACGPWLPFLMAEQTPQAENQSVFQIQSSFESITKLDGGGLVDVVVTQAMLFDGGTVAVISGQSAIIRVDSGLVQLTVCDGSQVEIQASDADRSTRFGAGTFDVPAGSAITVNSDDRYYITSASTGTDAEEASSTPMAATPVADGERSGSTLTIVTWGGIRLV